MEQIDPSEKIECYLDTEIYMERMLIEKCEALRRNKNVCSGCSFNELDDIKRILKTLNLLRKERCYEL